MYQFDLHYFSRFDGARGMTSLLYVALENALHDARRFSSAVDVTGSVAVINALTGEVVATFNDGICTFGDTEDLILED